MERLLTVFPEILFGDDKRKYDMSHKYIPDLLATLKLPDGSSGYMVKVKKEENPQPPIPLKTDYGRTIYLSKIGTLHYLLGSKADDYLSQYQITISRDGIEKYEDQYIVYSKIDLNKLTENSIYRSLIINELLSKNNIELSNASGYIGEIEPTHGENNQLSVGEELDADGGFYRYQVSPNYALFYDPQHLSAVVDYVKQQERFEKKKQNMQNSR